MVGRRRRLPGPFGRLGQLLAEPEEALHVALEARGRRKLRRIREQAPAPGTQLAEGRMKGLRHRLDAEKCLKLWLCHSK